jgi:DNA-binding CsgD family transcriptional regulator
MKKIILIEKRYLLQAGIQSLIQEIPGLMLLKSFSGDEPHLTEIILRYKPGMLIVNPLSLSPENTALPRKVRSVIKTNVLALLPEEEQPKNHPGYDELLFWNENKFDLEQKIRRHAKNIADQDTTHKALSSREITILKLIVQGLTHQQIADKLYLSIHTVNTHRKNINKKLGIKTVSGLMVYAIMNHLIETEALTKKK